MFVYFHKHWWSARPTCYNNRRKEISSHKLLSYILRIISLFNMENFMWPTIKSQHGHPKQEQLFDQMIPREDNSYCFIYLILLLLNFNQTTEFSFMYYLLLVYIYFNEFCEGCCGIFVLYICYHTVRFYWQTAFFNWHHNATFTSNPAEMLNTICFVSEVGF